VTFTATDPEPATRPAPQHAPLHRQPLFVRFWTAQTVSVFGDQVSALAIPLTAVIVLHASAFEVGLLTATAWLPNLLFSLPAGVWIDERPHRRRVMIAADVSRAAALATVPLAWWLDVLTVWQLLSVTFAVGALSVFFDLASNNFFVALVRRRQYVEAQSRLSTSRSGSYIAGPSFAGVLVQAVGAPGALLADACSFVASALLLRRMDVQEPPVERSSAHPLRRLADAFRHLFGDAFLRASLLCTATINFFNFVLVALFVLYASRTLGLSAGAIGLVLGVGAVGGLIGALVAPRIGRAIGSGRAVVLGALVFPAALALIPLAHGSPAVAGAMLLAAELGSAFGVMVFDVNQNALLTLHMPDTLRSRLVGAYRFVNYGTRPVGALVGGVLGSTLGVRETIWIAVVGGMLGVLFLIGSPLPRARQEDYAE
jgi:predicted MFS family arabinose efflux permease